MIKCGISMKSNSKNPESSDYLTPLLERAPAGWALIRANEIRALNQVNFGHPVLDVGCGDGLVAKVILKGRRGKFDFGLDISEREINKAKKIGSYKNCLVGDVYDLPFERNSFQTVFSNSTVEHFKNLNKALSEIHRVLKPGGQLIITVPSANLSRYLLGSLFFSFLGLKREANIYARFFHFLVKHYNIYNHEGWKKIFKEHDLKLIDYYYYHSPQMIQAHEIFSYLAIPQHLVRLVFGSWPMFINFRKVFIIPWYRQLFSRINTGDISKTEGGSLLLVAKKI